jgi:peptidoglycan/LPS O-acetylase OafA/YrhL
VKRHVAHRPTYLGQVLWVLASVDVFFVISGFGIFYSSLNLIGIKPATLPDSAIVRVEFLFCG